MMQEQEAPYSITCPEFETLSGIQHAFFTRKGGVSNGVYQSLNCGSGSADDPELVVENRKRAMQAMGASLDDLRTLYQVHSANVLVLASTKDDTQNQQADAMVTKLPGVVLGVLTADCCPVLFADPQARVIGAAHAGWRGAFSGVLAQTVDTMLNIGADVRNIHAVIGPTIGQPSYEVDQRFYDQFVSEDADYHSFFVKGQSQDRYYFDLPGFVTGILSNMGIRFVSNVGEDTYASPSYFFSWRRNYHEGQQDYGRLLSAIRLVEH